MREQIEIEVPVREDGVDIIKIVGIDMITNGMYREYKEINKIINNVRVLNSEMQEMMEKISESDKPLEIDNFQKQVKLKSDEIIRVGQTDFFKRRFRLILMILRKNRCTDLGLLDPNYWEENIDIETLINFIEVAMNKDFAFAKKKSPLAAI